MTDNEMRVTGVMVQYYMACKTELWFFANNIDYNEEDQNIKIGRLIHRESFKGEKKNVMIDNSIALDYVKGSSGALIVYEVKKSSRLEEPARKQVLYYLWYLKKMGIGATAMITYPKERRREQIILTKDDEIEMESIIHDIKHVVSLSRPPPPYKKPYCRKCSYFHLCWS